MFPKGTPEYNEWVHMKEAREHRCYEMDVNEIAADLAGGEEMSRYSSITHTEVAKFLKRWFDTAHDYWSNRD